MWEATFSRTNSGYDPGCFGDYIIINKISRIICQNICKRDKMKKVAQKRLNRATLCHDQSEAIHDKTLYHTALINTIYIKIYRS